MKRIAVLCGSSVGRRRAYANAAQALGRTLARRGVALVYGGAGVGLMAAAADAAIEAGGEVIGVITPDLADIVGHSGVRLERVAGMHERKARFSALADGYIALPGGFGTADELFEALTWNQLRLHDKPTGLLNVAGYFDHLLAFLRHAEGERFIRPEHRNSLLVDDRPGALIDAMASYERQDVDKWWEGAAEED